MTSHAFFSNGLTRAVYENIANRPDLWDRVLHVIHTAPSEAADEIKSVVVNEVNLTKTFLGHGLVRQIVDEALTDVKWREIRDQLKREAA
jgi:hypothetical protein